MDHAISFRHGDSDDLNMKLQDVIDHPDKKERYAYESEDYICNRYNWDDVVKRTLCVYGEDHEKND